MASGKTILVLHLAGRIPMGGVAWQALHYLLGLKRFGHDVYYIEDSGAPPYDPRVRSIVEDCSYSVNSIKRMMDRYDLGDRWSFWDMAHDTYYGLDGNALRRLYGEADALFNICGATRLRDEHLACPIRVYVQTDPVYEQMREAQGDEQTRAAFAAHTHHFTYGENLGHADCLVPLDNFTWRPTRPPVLLDLWECRVNPAAKKFTTIAVWKNTGKDIVFDGEKYYWSKHLNYARFQDLPRMTSAQIEVALDRDGASAHPLEPHGWGVVDSYAVSRDLDLYRDYIYDSRGEFSISKDLVVRTSSGWFSDRSVCYLAAGKPVITQETGFSKFINTGRGLFSFSSMEEVLASFAEIDADYPGHCRAAREIAEDYFAADKVLGKMLADVGL